VGAVVVVVVVVVYLQICTNTLEDTTLLQTQDRPINQKYSIWNLKPLHKRYNR